MALPAEPGLKEQILDFDCDRYINPWIPHNRLYMLPKPISRWFGYREQPSNEPYALIRWPITVLATIAGLCFVGGIGNYTPGIQDWHPPVIIASLGASAILDFNTIRSPLAQPRNSIFGNTLAAICGVAISKLFQHNADFHNIQWVSGAFGCALASLVMSITNTIHPPGGATAVLASTNMAIIKMGWKFVPIILLDSTLLVVVALIFNNCFRQYPVFWWTPDNAGKKLRSERHESKTAEEGEGPQKATSDTSSDRTLHRQTSQDVEYKDGVEEIVISHGHMQLPSHMRLSRFEMEQLEAIQARLYRSQS